MSLIRSALLLFCSALPYLHAAPAADLRVELNRRGVDLSPHLYGLFFEDINYGADGGLYAELVQNRSFEYHPRSKPEQTALYAWEPIARSGATVNLLVATSSPLNTNNPHYLDLTLTGTGNGGVANLGFGGIAVTAAARYDVALFGRVASWEGDAALTVALELPDGTVIASTQIERLETKWTRREAVLVADRTADDARLVLTSAGRGVLSLDMVSLFPQDTWRARKYGLRKDLVQALADLSPKFLRFPGGCIAHGAGLANAYRWKDTVGDIAERKPNWNLWGYHQTYGLGYFEYFQLCADLGAQPLPVVPVGVSCGFHSGGGVQCVPMAELQEHIQDALDLIEFANGPADSRWGSVRARMGRPEPFGLRYLCLGNEEHDTPEFHERFPHFVRAIREAHPEIRLIGNSGLSANIPLYDLMHRQGVYSSDEHYYELPEWFLRNQRRFDSFDRSKPKIFVGEYASWNNTVFSALAEAAYLTGIERNGDIVDMTAYAPLLARTDFTQWTPDLIYFDARRVLRTVNYYTQQLFARNKGDYTVAHSFRAEGLPPRAAAPGRFGLGTFKSTTTFTQASLNGRPIDLASWSPAAGSFATTPAGLVQTDSNLAHTLTLAPSAASGEHHLFQVRARRSLAGDGLLILFGADASGMGGYVWQVGADGGRRHTLHQVRAYDHWSRMEVASARADLLADDWLDLEVDLSPQRVLCRVGGVTVLEHVFTPFEPAVSVTYDRAASELILKLVNPHPEPLATRVRLDGVRSLAARGRLTTLGSSRDAQNTFEQPNLVLPLESTLPVSTDFIHSVPAWSLQVLRIPATTP